MANDQTGIFLLDASGSVPGRAFPKEFRRGVFSRFDRKFAIIVLCCGAFFFSVVGLLSLRKPSDVVSEAEITRIQERYARLVLNQPKVEPVQEVTEEAGPKQEKSAEAIQEKKEEVKVDREKETFVQKQKRKEAGSEERRQVREQIAKQVQSAGIFAAITAAGNSGGVSASASDLLGTAGEGISDISSLNISKGTFATRTVEQTDLTSRKGSKTSGVDIKKEVIGKAAAAEVTVVANVNITSQAPEVSGESSSHSDRSQATIQRVVSREAQRLKRVYEDWLKRDPSLHGRLTIKFVILPSGAVSTVAVVKTTTNNSEFDDAIMRYIKRWQFPAVPDASPVEVVYPFVFEGLS